MPVKYINSLKTFIFFCTILIVSKNSFSQKQKFYNRYWSVNLNIGGSFYQGDISQVDWPLISFRKNNWKRVFGFQISKQFNSVVSLRGQAHYGKISGEGRQFISNRFSNVYYESTFFEYSLCGTFNFTNSLFNYGRHRNRLTTYGLFGLGHIHFFSDIYNLSNNGVIGGKGHGNGAGINGATFEMTGSGGIGMNYYLNKNIEYNIEWKVMMISTDYLDTKKANFKYDYFTYISVGIGYKFFNRYKRF